LRRKFYLRQAAGLELYGDLFKLRIKAKAALSVNLCFEGASTCCLIVLVVIVVPIFMLAKNDRLRNVFVGKLDQVEYLTIARTRNPFVVTRVVSRVLFRPHDVKRVQ